MRLRIVLALALAAAGALCGSAQARVYIPGVKIVFEVRTPQGNLRSYQQPGLPPTYWDQCFPARCGDRVQVDALVATGGAELEQVRICLDGKEIACLDKAPWRVEINTAGLPVGYHGLEVRAKTANPRSRETLAKAVLVLVAADERTGLTPGESDTERLSAVIGGLAPELDRALDENATAVLAKPELLFASAGPEAKEFFYTLSREGQVVYTSPLLPIVTYMYLVPELVPPAVQGKAAEPTATPGAPVDAWLAPGEVVLTVQVGDGAGRFGPPVGVTLQIQPEEVKP